MRIATISNEGLCLMGVLVTALWGFVAADRLIQRRANLEVIRTMKQLKSLQIQNHRHSPLHAPRKQAEHSSSVTLAPGCLTVLTAQTSPADRKISDSSSARGTETTRTSRCHLL
jgi:hypothetical protein